MNDEITRNDDAFEPQDLSQKGSNKHKPGSNYQSKDLKDSQEAPADANLQPVAIDFHNNMASAQPHSRITQLQDSDASYPLQNRDGLQEVDDEQDDLYVAQEVSTKKKRHRSAQEVEDSDVGPQSSQL